ncbi:hypothetical protein [Pseudoalteromonas tunicata]|jgi:predicted nucleic acid-binding protein|uniref:Uncharacterized protein n=1 Tax=Pseudoalteromonas tunicata D2 TaxID=87626 RepID=A4CCN9_9GAMM|nr:hypothetical protein [Pseudoalteromonas tunicata]ATC93833.1 hypothetical protein PTUN_a1163 [Pseudoalteromonas tunicata]AXT29648.1 hypothetical protein D1819_01640 [Pseudoalteromonas tunicata]EAR27332.1 hypothetical protein PTD2_14872 [Pseudoalteromonas tunicata D2]
MSVYCKFAWKISDDLSVKDALNQFAQRYFDAQAAVQLEEYQYAVDNGMNDLRAVIKPEHHLITFCCRYKKDIQRTENIVKKFAHENGLQIVVLQ